MNQLKVIERNEQRVLTSEQIAEAFGTDLKRVAYNFNYNKERYEAGKHYFELTGEERKEFINRHEIQSSLKHSKNIYLWTEKGAFLHAKSLNTDQAWNAYTQLVDDYFKKVEEAKQPQHDISSLSPQLQFMILMEQRTNALETKINMYEAKQTKLEQSVSGIEDVKETVDKLSDSLTAVPDHTKVVSTINEFARWTRLGHNEVYNKVYETLKNVHGIDIRQRVENERDRIQQDYNNKTGRWYSESTLKQKVNGIDIMVRIGCLDKFHSILAGMLAKEKVRSTLSLVQ